MNFSSKTEQTAGISFARSWVGSLVRWCMVLAGVTTSLYAVVPSPYTEVVGFSAQITGMGSFDMTLTAESTVWLGTEALGSTAETNMGYARFKPGQRYRLDLTASGPGQYAIGFSVPDGYALYVDGQQTDMITRYPGGGYYAHGYDLELRPSASFSRGEAGAFSGISIGKAVTWDVALGGLRTGRSAGRIFFREKDLTGSPASRDRLYYTAPANEGQIDLIYDGPVYKHLRQVKTPQVFIDLIDGSGGYWMKFYDPALATSPGGMYTVTGTPWKTLWVESPAGNQLRITETEGSTVRVSHLSLTSGTVASGTYAWQLQEGGSGGAWLRTETHSSSYVSGARHEVIEVRTGGTGGTVVSKAKYIYNTFAWIDDEEEVVQTISDPDGTPLTTTYTYHTNSAARGNYRRVASVTSPTGNWTSYAYYDDWNRRGQLEYQFSPWVDAPSVASATTSTGRVVRRDYAEDWTGRYRNLVWTEERVNNVITGQSSAAYDNAWGPGEPYWEKSWSYVKSASSVSEGTYTMIMREDVAADEVGQPKMIFRPDQTKTVWVHARGNWSGGVFTKSSTGTHWREVKIDGSNISFLGENQNYYDSQWFNSLYLRSGRSTAAVTIRDAAGNAVHTESQVYAGSGGWNTMTSADFTYDISGRLTSQVASNGATSGNTYTGGRLTSSIDATGTEVQFTYDYLGRVATSTKKGAAASGSYLAQPDITTTYTYDGAGRVTQSVVTGSTLTLTSSTVYSLSGRVTSTTAPGSYTTSMAYTSGGKIVTATLPGGATKISETYLDGQTKQLTGTGQVAGYWTYNVEAGTGRKWSQQTLGWVSAGWTNTYFDWLGRQREQWTPGWNNGFARGVIWTYSDRGQLTKVERSGLNPTLYAYDAMGRVEFTALDVDNDGVIGLGNTDRVTAYDWNYNYNYGDPGWEYNELETTFPTAGSSGGKILRTTAQKLSGFTSGRLSQSRSADINGNITLSYTTVDRTNKLVTSVVQAPTSTILGRQIAYNGLIQESRDLANVTNTFQYDGLGRGVKTFDPRTGTAAETGYIAGTNLVSWAKDTAGNTQAAYTYDSAGRVFSVRDVYNRYSYTTYTARGEVERQWGETVQPVSYAYNTLGQMSSMQTYRGGSGWTAGTWPASPGTADTTTWTYDAYTGHLNQKSDAVGRATNYTYTATGQIATRQWARGVTATYAYSGVTGELTGVSYSDATPGVSYTYNRLGQVVTTTDINVGGATQTRTFEYDATSLQLKTEILPAALHNRRITYEYQDGTGGTVAGRPKGYTLGITGALAQDLSTIYGYDTYGRTNSVVAGHAGLSSRTFGYSYVANSSLLAEINDTASGYKQVRGYESNRNYMTGLTTQFASTVKSGFTYAYNELGQRTSALQAGEAFADFGDSTYYRYGYNARSELISARGYLGTNVASTTAPLPGRQFDFGYDEAGNRKLANTTGLVGTEAEYTANALNQLTQREVNYTTASGTADAAAKVVINGSLAGRQGKYWSGEVALNNLSTPAYATMNAKVVKTGATNYKNTSSVLSVFLAKTPEVFSYDYDGNLTQDGQWTYTYDAENRLTGMETRADVRAIGLPGKKLEFAYDGQGRRVMKKQSNWTGSAWSLQSDLRFVYQGWNLIGEFDAAGNRVRSYAWGLDITGSMGATGGIGAMVQMIDYTSTTTAYLPGYDAQGNVTALMTTAGVVAAAYEYGPFGELLRKDGAYAETNPLRNATKYTDKESNLVYYGHRYYSANMGRFINRDRAEEFGGINLYRFLMNDGVNKLEYLGLEPVSAQGTESYYGFGPVRSYGNYPLGYTAPQMPTFSPATIQIVNGVWNMTSGITSMVAGTTLLSGTVATGGLSTVAGVIMIVSGTTQAGLGFAQIMGGISGRNTNVPGSISEAVGQASGSPTAEVATSVAISALTLNPRNSSVKQLLNPKNTEELIGLADAGKTFGEAAMKLDDIANELGGLSAIDRSMVIDRMDMSDFDRQQLKSRLGLSFSSNSPGFSNILQSKGTDGVPNGIPLAPFVVEENLFKNSLSPVTGRSLTNLLNTSISNVVQITYNPNTGEVTVETKDDAPSGPTLPDNSLWEQALSWQLVR